MALFSSFTNRLHYGLRFLAAYILMVVFFLLNVIALPYPFSGIVNIPFFLMGLYYWSVYRPTLLPPWLVFLAGGLMDILSGTPLGLNALIFIIFQWITIDQRKILTGQNFFVVWIGFSALIGLTLSVQWGVFGLLNGQFSSIKPLLVSFGLSMSLFPFVSLLLQTTHKLLPLPHPLKLFKAKS